MTRARFESRSRQETNAVFARKAGAAFQHYLGQWAPGEEMHLHPVGGQAGPEVNIRIRVHSHRRTIVGDERRVVDIELDGPEVGRPQLRLIL